MTLRRYTTYNHNIFHDISLDMGRPIKITFGRSVVKGGVIWAYIIVLHAALCIGTSVGQRSYVRIRADVRTMLVQLPGRCA